MSYADPEVQKARDRERQRARYYRAKAAGLCGQCKYRTRAPGMSTCARCRPLINRAFRRRRRRRRRLLETRQKRSCSVCGERSHNIRTCPDRPVPVCDRCGSRIWGTHECISAVEAGAARKGWP